MSEEETISRRATQSQWAGFVESVIWTDLEDLLLDHIEVNRNLLEGLETQEDEYKESDEALRGRNRFARELLAFIRGWADGTIPIAK
jgi:hypothetical protein